MGSIQIIVPNVSCCWHQARPTKLLLSSPRTPILRALSKKLARQAARPCNDFPRVPRFVSILAAAFKTPRSLARFVPLHRLKLLGNNGSSILETRAHNAGFGCANYHITLQRDQPSGLDLYLRSSSCVLPHQMCRLYARNT